jgi:hypothetical protein
MVKVHIDKVKKHKNADDEFHFSLGEEGDDYTTSDDPLSNDFDSDDDSSFDSKFNGDDTDED